MAQICEISYNVQGDIGGTGISRFWFIPQTAGPITVAHANAVAAAARALLFAAAGNIPTPITWTCNSQANVYDWATGLVQGPLAVTSLPAVVTGSGGSNFAAGVGARINWKTATVIGRRLIRGAIFVAPLASVSFNASGSVQPTFVGTMNTAAAAYLAALNTAGLNAVIWHRPPKGTFVGGQTGIVTGGVTSSVPASLRSRRE